MKTRSWVLVGVLGVVGVVVAAAAVFAVTFDPNRYKGEIERLAKERTGRTLKLAGDLKVAFFPSVGATVAGVTLSERGSDQTFLAVDSAHGAVALMPLLHGQVVIDRIDVKGLKANVVKGKDGRYNFSDLLEPEGAKDAKSKQDKSPPSEPGKKGGPVAFDIAGVNIERSSIDYKDLASGKELALTDVKLATGRVSEKADGKLEFAAAVKGRNPDVDAHVNLSGDYKVDLPAKAYALSKVDGAIRGTFDKGSLDAKLTAPKIDIAADKASGDAVQLQLTLKEAQRTTEAAIKLGGVQGSAKALVIPSIDAQISLSGSDMPKAFKLPITGKAEANLEKQTASADLHAKVDESAIQAKLGLAKFSPPAYTFDVNVDKLNLDQYFPPKKEASSGAPAPAAKGDGGKGAPASAPKQEADSAVDLSFLKDLNANGRVQFGALQVKGLKLASVKAEIKAANGRLDVAPHSASLYEGTLAGALSAQASGNRISLKENLANVSVGPLLRDAAKLDRLEGRGNVALDVTGAGASVNAIKKSLDGSAKVALRDGAIKGVDIGALLQKVKSLGKSDEGSANNRDQTTFSELNASFTIKNGVAHNQDLDLKAPLLRVNGAGDVDIGNSALNYTVKAAVVATTKGQGGKGLDQLSGLTVPVKLNGPFDGLKYQVDYGAAAAELAKSKVGEKVQEGLEKNKGKIEEQLGGKLKGLFGR
jgi:AsmA protein